MDKRRLTKLQKLALKRYKTAMCTKCGMNPVVTGQVTTYFSSCKVRIQLCESCSEIIITSVLDNACEGTKRQILIDKLSKFGQL